MPMMDKTNKDSIQKEKIANGKEISLEKHRKFLKKKELQRKIKQRKDLQKSWILAHSHFATDIDSSPNLSLHDIQQFQFRKKRKKIYNQTCSAQEKISSEIVKSNDKDEIGNSLIINKLLEPYLNLKEGSNLSKKTNDENQQMFIAEGTEIVRLLIQQYTRKKKYSVELCSILVKPCALFDEPVKLIQDVEEAISCKSNRLAEEKKQSKGKPKPNLPFHIMIGSEDTLSAIAGFHICRGAMACGKVPQKYTETWFWKDFLVENNKYTCTTNGSMKRDYNYLNGGKKSIRILALERISNTANLGSMIRSSTAFGIDIILLSENSCDAWYRQSVRVSMGHVFTIPIVRVHNLIQAIQRMQRIYSIKSYASVVVPDKIIDEDAKNNPKPCKSDVCILENLPKGSVSSKWCCVMGNEANGLSNEVIEACNEKITIGTSEGVDSLSVQVATGILLHGLCEREQK